MAEDDAATLEIKGLDQILKALKAKPPNARVGILGAKNSRTGKANSNATIGAAHEFGTSRLPQRSFLRVPLTEKLQKEMERSGAFDKNVLSEVMRSGTVIPWMKKMAQIAEEIVSGAFDTGGYGKWPSWKNGYTSRTGNILVDTNQLRQSITSEVT